MAAANLATRCRYMIGSSVARMRGGVLSSRWFPLTRIVPYGIDCWYDVQRFAATRRLTIIFDVGANVGQTVGGLVKYFPLADIYCFEPGSAPFAKLSAAFGQRSNVRCIKMALGATRETKKLYVAADSELNTFVADGPRQDRLQRSELANVETVDSFCQAHNIGQIDILKMDVQGWESEVLRGADRILAANKVRFVISEVGFSRRDSDMAYFADIHATLEDRGFRFCGLYDAFRWGERKPYVGFANALYLDPQFPPQ